MNHMLYDSTGNVSYAPEDEDDFAECLILWDDDEDYQYDCYRDNRDDEQYD